MAGLGRVTNRLLLPALLLLAASSAAAATHLVDPVTGDRQTIEVGAPALHLVFFATWCPDCVDELEELSELDDRWSGRGYRLIIIAVQNRHTAERLKDFLEARDLSIELWWDVDGAAARRFEAESIPTHVVLDSKGKELARSSKLDDQIRDAVASTVDKRRRSRGQR